MNRRTDNFGSSQSWINHQAGAGFTVQSLYLQFIQFPQSPTTFEFDFSWFVTANHAPQDYNGQQSYFIPPQTFSIFDVSPASVLSTWQGLNTKYGATFPVVGSGFPYVSSVWMNTPNVPNGQFFGCSLSTRIDNFTCTPVLYYSDFQAQLRANSLYTGCSASTPASLVPNIIAEFVSASPQSKTISIKDLSSSSGYLLFMCFPGPSLIQTVYSLTVGSQLTFGTSCSFSYYPDNSTLALSPTTPSVVSQYSPDQNSLISNLDSSTIQIPSNYLAGEGNRPQ
jgi:hypothetical protein